MIAADQLRRHLRLVALAAVMLAALLLVPLVASSFALRILQTIFFGAGLAIAWNILGGYAGYWSFGHAAFLGLGAFVGALLQEHFSAASFVTCLLAGGGAAAVLALVLGYPLLRLRGTYFAIAMLGVSLVLGELSSNVELFEGALGIVIYPVSGEVAPAVFYYYVFLILAGISFLVSFCLRYSKLGYGLIAIREDEETARMLGVPTDAYKIVTFVVSGLLTGLIGSAYAFSLGYITTGSVFRPDLSLSLIVYSLLGGMGTLTGPIIGAAAMTVLTQVILSDFLQIHMMITGAVIIALVFLMPKGIVGLVSRQHTARTADGPHKEALPEELPRALAALGQNDGSKVLELKDLTMQFRGLRAIDGISLAVRSGELYSIIGPNGAGKSTIFNMVTGYLKPSAGTVAFEGRRIDGMATHRLSQLGIARAFQISRPFQDLTVYENVLVGALFGREGAREVANVTAGALAMTGLRDLSDEMAASLPVGHLRKLELARVIATRPSLVLADEPCAGLNATESGEMVSILNDLRRRGVTVLLVEHDMATVMKVSDRIFVVAAGRAVAEGAPGEIAHNPHVIEAYLGKSMPGEEQSAHERGLTR